MPSRSWATLSSSRNRAAASVGAIGSVLAEKDGPSCSHMLPARSAKRLQTECPPVRDATRDAYALEGMIRERRADAVGNLEMFRVDYKAWMRIGGTLVGGFPFLAAVPHVFLQVATCAPSSAGPCPHESLLSRCACRLSCFSDKMVKNLNFLGIHRQQEPEHD